MRQSALGESESVIFGPSGTQFRLYCDCRKRRDSTSTSAITRLELAQNNFDAAFTALLTAINEPTQTEIKLGV